MRLPVNWLVHWADETIAAARKSLHKPGIVGLVPQCESDFGNRRIERMLKINKGIFGPDLWRNSSRVTNSPACSSRMAQT